MVIAVPLVLMVQMPVNQVINVVAVGHGLMAATWPMVVRGLVGRARMPLGTGRRIRI